METIGLYEPEEMSLFGGELLMGLGSPLEPELVNAYPYDGVEGTTAVELLGKESLLQEKPILTPSSISPTPATNLQDQASCLDLNWLDTKLDLYSLLGDSTTDEASSLVASASVPLLSPSPITTPESPPITAEDLFNQISCGTLQQPATVVEETDNRLLVEVFNKLSSDIEQLVDAETFDVPDLGQGVLSPVSVDDIESLLSGPVSPASTSDQTISPSHSSSCLESLLTSPIDSPRNDVQFESSNDTDYEAGPVRRKTRRRTRPYQEGPPLDRKERKKLQNKNAALKYRQKKKVESESIDDQCTNLETRNKELHEKVDSITREIQYLKDLMGEVVKAKGIKTNK